MNKHKKHNLLKFAVWTKLCLLLTIPALAQQNPVFIDGIIAKVDNYIILKSDWESSYAQVLKQQQSSGSEELKCQILQSLVINKMLLAKAEIDSIMVEEKMVDNQLDRRMDYFVRTFGSEDRLEEYYGKTVEQLKEELRREVRDQMTVQKVEESITSDIRVTPKDVKQFFERIPEDSVPYLPAEVEIGQVVMTPKPNPQAKNEAKLKLLNIREEIKDGADFGEMAKKHSDDPGSAKYGGDLGWWNRGDMVPEFEAAAFKLQESEMSSVVESEHGFHLIKLHERKGDKYHASHILIKPESTQGDDSYTYAFLDSLRKEILAGRMRFEKAAKEYSEDEQSKASGGYLMDQSGQSTRIPEDQLESGVYFTIDTMEVGQMSQPMPYRMPTGKKALRIIYYKSRIKPHYANLKDDYQKLRAIALQEKKAQAMDHWFDNTKDEVYISVDDEYADCVNLKNL